jgi:hypothetical protein
LTLINGKKNGQSFDSFDFQEKKIRVQKTENFLSNLRNVSEVGYFNVVHKRQKGTSSGLDDRTVGFDGWDENLLHEAVHLTLEICYDWTDAFFHGVQKRLLGNVVQLVGLELQGDLLEEDQNWLVVLLENCID